MQKLLELLIIMTSTIDGNRDTAVGLRAQLLEEELKHVPRTPKGRKLAEDAVTYKCMKNTMKAYKIMKIRAKIGLKCLMNRNFFLELFLKQIVQTNLLFNQVQPMPIPIQKKNNETSSLDLAFLLRVMSGKKDYTSFKLFRDIEIDSVRMFERFNRRHYSMFNHNRSALVSRLRMLKS
jgi:hypothetical protein